MKSPRFQGCSGDSRSVYQYQTPNMAEDEHGTIVIGSDDEFSDNDDVIVTKIEIEVDSEDVVFLSETKAPPKFERDFTPLNNSERAADDINITDNGTKPQAPPSLNRSTSLTTETGRLFLDDNLKVKTNNSGAVFCSVPGPLDLSAKHSVHDSSNHNNSCNVTYSSSQLLNCDFQQGIYVGQNQEDKLKFQDPSMIPVSSEGTKTMVGTSEHLSIIAAGPTLGADRNIPNQNNQTVVISQATSTGMDQGTYNSNVELRTNCVTSVFPTCIPNPMPLCNDFMGHNMQPLVCNVTPVKSSPPTQNNTTDVKQMNLNVPVTLMGQTTSVITHSSMAGSPIMTHTSIACSTSSMSVSSTTTSVTTPMTSGAVTGSQPGMSLTGNVPRTSPTRSDPFTTSHLLLASLDSPWLNGSQSRHVFHPNSSSCCLKTGALTGSQTCAHGCQQTQTGLCDNFVSVSQSTGCVGGLPGGSMMILKNNSLKRSLSSSDKTCMYNSLTLPLSMQNPLTKHSASMSNLGTLSGMRGSDVKTSRNGSLSTRPLPMFNDSAIPLPPKKQKRCYSQEGPRMMCTNCTTLLAGEDFSQCPNGHSTCSRCLKERVKLVLSGKEKESIKCLNRQCDSFYPMSELKLTLSPFVVEILEEKLDSEMIADMIMKNGDVADDNEEDYQMESETASTCFESSIKKEQFLKKYDDMPDNWDAIEERVVSKNGYELVRLEPRTPEYDNIVAKFFESMVDSNVEVVHVHRVQNPIQWKYYTVKKAEMTQDNDGFGCVEEQQLFHGTNSTVVEAICRKGFDWRLCGKHGTMYGQGSYFAVNASYSHQYTDLRQPKKMGVGSTMMSANPFSMTLPTQPSFIYPPVNVNFGQFPAPIVMSQNSAFSALNLSQSTPPTPTGLPQSSSFITQTGSSISHSSQQHNTISSSNSVFPSTSTGIRRVCGLQIPGTSQTIQTGNRNNNGGTTSQSGGQTCSLNNRKPRVGPYKICKLKVNPKPAHIRQVSGLASAHIVTSSDIIDPPRPTAKMFLAKVLVGKYVGGESKYRKPPPLEPKSDPFGRCYDSCVDDIRNPKIFVIFDSAQAYPEYLMEYSYM